jgi:hypothetical protein
MGMPQFQVTTGASHVIQVDSPRWRMLVAKAVSWRLSDWLIGFAWSHGASEGRAPVDGALSEGVVRLLGGRMLREAGLHGGQDRAHWQQRAARC